MENRASGEFSPGPTVMGRVEMVFVMLTCRRQELLVSEMITSPVLFTAEARRPVDLRGRGRASVAGIAGDAGVLTMVVMMPVAAVTFLIR